MNYMGDTFRRHIIGICCLYVHFAILISITTHASFAQRTTVSMVVDGDRIILSDGQKISLTGIDAPEKHVSPKLTRDALASGRSEKAVIRQGELAAAYLNKIAGGYPVLVKPVGPGEEYIPALVYVTDPLGDILYSLNQQMIVSGFAIANPRYHLKETRLYATLEKQAREERRGIWADEDIISIPRAGTVLPDIQDPVSGNCSRNTACVWVSNGTLAAGSGMWASRPGRDCPCSVD